MSAAPRWLPWWRCPRTRGPRPWRPGMSATAAAASRSRGTPRGCLPIVTAVSSRRMNRLGWRSISSRMACRAAITRRGVTPTVPCSGTCLAIQRPLLQPATSKIHAVLLGAGSGAVTGAASGPSSGRTPSKRRACGRSVDDRYVCQVRPGEGVARAQQRQNLFSVRFPPPGAEVRDVRQFAVGARWTPGEIPERRARKNHIRFDAARPRPVLAPGVQAVVPIAHLVGLAIGLGRALGRGAGVPAGWRATRRARGGGSAPASCRAGPAGRRRGAGRGGRAPSASPLP